MNNRKLVKQWHRRIIRECEHRIGRNLSDNETQFVTSRGGFIALEMIEDTVMATRGEELVSYLNSEAY